MNDVEVVHFSINKDLLQVRVGFVEGMTVALALDKSGLLASHPELHACSVGIFSQTASMDALVKPGDRLELYRPLLADPKEIRRQRAKGVKN